VPDGRFSGVGRALRGSGSGFRRALRDSGRRRAGAAVGAIALVAVAIVVIVGAEPGSSQGAGRVAKSSGGATVQRRNLVATDTESGTLGYANAQTVFNRLSGTITSLPAVGHVVKPGQTLYRVDGAPVVLFDGVVPAYRALSDGVSAGADVTQLKRNLVHLGFDPNHQITINNTFDAATTAAVERWQASLGQTQTGTVTLGTMVFLPGAQRITSVSAVLGSNGGSSSAASGAGAASSASTTVPAPRPEFVVLSTATHDATTQTSTTTPTSTTPTSTTTTPTTTTPGTTHPGSGSGGGTAGGSRSSGKTPSSEAILLALLKAETLELKKELGSGAASSRSAPSSQGAGAGTGGGGRGGGGGSGGGGGGSGGSGGGGASGAAAASGSAGAGASSSGSGAASAQAIMQTTANKLVVTVDLDATKQSEAVVGEPVSVQLPTGNTVGGRITAVSSVAQSTSSSSSSSTAGGTGAGGGGAASSTAPSATIPVTIDVTGHHPLAGLDQAAVSVNFQQQVQRNVLSVPVSALLATAGGNYAVQAVAPPHRLIPVTPGLFAAGFVQISGTEIVPGLQVTDSQG
jgi:Putative peptidoglycan binding domain